jgi:hypothetical protein
MGLITGPYSAFFQSCDELFGVRTGETGISGEGNYTRVFRVVVKMPELGPYAVGVCPGVPLSGSFYQTPSDFDLLSLLVKKRAQEENKDDWQNWLVTCDYSRNIPLRGGPPPQDSRDKPDIEYPEVEFDFTIMQKALERDLDGNPFLNSAHQPFVPAPTFSVAHVTLNITRNELGFSTDKASDYAFAINSDTFLGKPPEAWICHPPKSRQVWRGSFRYNRTSYKLMLSVRRSSHKLGESPYYSWEYEPIDSGCFKYVPKGAPVPLPFGNLSLPAPKPTWQQIWRNGAPVQTPVPLDGMGNEQLPGDDGIIKPVFLHFHTNNLLSFNSLIVQGLT